MQPARLRLGQLLIDAHILSAEQLEQVLERQKTDGRRLGTLLVESGLVTETQLTQILSQQLSVPWVSLYHIDFSRELLNLVPRDVAEKYCIVPIYIRPVRGLGETLYVAMDDPMNEEALRECAKSSGLPARPMIAAPTAILKAIRLYYGGSVSPPRTAAPLATTVPAPAAAGEGRSQAETPLVTMPATATARSRAAPVTAPIATPSVAVVSMAAGASAPAIDNGTGDSAAAVPLAQTTAISAPGVARADDGPVLEVREIELPKKSRKRANLNFALLDGTTIKFPSGRKRRGEASVPPSEGAGDHELSVADLLAALRAAAHGADATDVLGSNMRWEKIMAALLSLLLRKHLILERELLEELRKI